MSFLRRDGALKGVWKDPEEEGRDCDPKDSEGKASKASKGHPSPKARPKASKASKGRGSPEGQQSQQSQRRPAKGQRDASEGKASKANKASKGKNERKDAESKGFGKGKGNYHPDADRWNQCDLTRSVLIVSAGLMNFEDSQYSNGASHDFTKFRTSKFGNRKPHSGFLTDNGQGAGIAKSSFRSCFPELCEGRQVIFLDCTLVPADPGDDGELRGHNGRHWRNVEKFVDHPSFEELNGGLKEIDPEANLLIVCFCNQGRHRSVAEKEVLYDLFKRKWFGSRKGNVTQIDLQCKQWKRLCAPDCVDCNCKSRAFKDAINRGISRITDFLPTRKMPNPMWPDGVHPRAKAQVKEFAAGRQSGEGKDGKNGKDGKGEGKDGNVKDCEGEDDEDLKQRVASEASAVKLWTNSPKDSEGKASKASEGHASPKAQPRASKASKGRGSPEVQQSKQSQRRLAKGQRAASEDKASKASPPWQRNVKARYEKEDEEELQRTQGTVRFIDPVPLLSPLWKARIDARNAAQKKSHDAIKTQQRHQERYPNQ